MDTVLIPALQQSIVLLPLCLGVYLTYRIMQVTDLTVEGTFVLGAAVFSRLVVHGQLHVFAIMLAILAASFVGLLVSLVQRVASLDALMTSILAVFMLYSVNFKVMGTPNISLLSVNTFMQRLINAPMSEMLLGLSAMAAMVVLLMYLLLRSRLGLLLRVYGDNNHLLEQLAQPKLMVLTLGCMLSNALAALSGVLSAQLNAYADIKMGTGIALTAIGSVILGLNLLRPFFSSTTSYKPLLELLASFIGVLIYFMSMNYLLYIGIDPIYMKLALGILLMVVLSGHHLSKREVSHA